MYKDYFDSNLKKDIHDLYIHDLSWFQNNKEKKIVQAIPSLLRISIRSSSVKDSPWKVSTAFFRRVAAKDIEGPPPKATATMDACIISSFVAPASRALKA